MLHQKKYFLFKKRFSYNNILMSIWIKTGQFCKYYIVFSNYIKITIISNYTKFKKRFYDFIYCRYLIIQKLV